MLQTIDNSIVLTDSWLCRNLMKEKEVDLYINGHDHCLQQISSPNR